jgi:hypothetical protein
MQMKGMRSYDSFLGCHNKTPSMGWFKNKNVGFFHRSGS